ncbi:MAG: hypothetical protein OJF49_001072 [Ktedonobacterales bacterium]|jgi:bifunctional pyridoxal-dependent enzyme with beta-cystathionase and maltose regulon repressor activities|nr:MAG: hypothetical protein OJF49_001072 [Ktedonobacterales bacterium]
MRVDPAVTLTSQLKSASLAHYDLGSGYAQIMVPDYILDAYSDAGWLDTFNGQVGHSDLGHDASQRLDEAVRSFLGMRGDSSDWKVFSTYSGSIALDRALTGMINLLKSRGRKVVQVVTTSPCIDIMGLLLAEHSHVRAHYVRSNRGQALGELDAQALVDRLAWLRQAFPDDGRLVLLASPENPTGFLWDSDALHFVARACAEHDAPLLVDHSFLLAGVHQDIPARVWDAADDSNLWVGLWDTGKTIGLAGDKLGFIITSNDEVSRYVEEALAVTQFDISVRQKMTFSRILEVARDREYVDVLRRLCRENLQTLELALMGTGIEVRSPLAGSLVVLTLPEGYRDEHARLRLLDADVGVVAGSVFFHDTWIMRNMLRLALARDVDYFGGAVEIMAQVLGPALKRGTPL